MKKFNCLCCGDCCSGDMSIKLNIYDLYKMAKHLKLSNTKELFDKRFFSLKTGQNGTVIPGIIFKKQPYQFCPFLINDLNENMELKGFCSLHPYIKPLVCILAPTSKLYNSEDKSSEYSFTKPTENCPGDLIGQDYSIDIILDSVKNEMKFENQFFELLNMIMNKEFKNYQDKLYFFKVSDSFTKIFDDIKNYFEKS